MLNLTFGNDVDAESILTLKERYECPHFRVLIIGRANAGKTTILEKVCGVAQGTKPIIYDEEGVHLKANTKATLEPQLKSRFKLLVPIKQLLELDGKTAPTHLTPSVEVCCMYMMMVLMLIHNLFQRGIHNIEHQITYPGCNFIFHDSQGFESGASGEIEIGNSLRSSLLNLK